MTKSELEEKIKNSESVWVFDCNGCIKEVQTIETFFADNGNVFCYHLGNCEIENAFATKEEAEWELEFGNIERTEKLSLPTWEEIQSKLDKKQIVGKYYYYVKHFTKPNETNVEKTYSMYLLLNGNIVIDDNAKVKTLFDKPLTKENYIEACRLCKKLFLKKKGE